MLIICKSTQLPCVVIFFRLLVHFFTGLLIAKLERKSFLPPRIIISITRRVMRSTFAMNKPLTIAQTVFFLFASHISW
jgi:hypothetical protein